MKLRVETRDRARKLRQQGASYREIREAIGEPVSKGTLNHWLKQIVLTPEQELRLVEKMRSSGQHGRQLGALANRAARQQRLQIAQAEARSQFPGLMDQPLFIIGLMLYWAEGSKTQESFQFMNSDPRLIQLMMQWLRNVTGVLDTQISIRLYTHRMYSEKNAEQYWLTVTGLPLTQLRKTVFKPTPHTVKKNPSYLGCLRIQVSGVSFFRKIQLWQQMIFESFVSPRGITDNTPAFEAGVRGSIPLEGTR